MLQFLTLALCFTNQDWFCFDTKQALTDYLYKTYGTTVYTVNYGTSIGYCTQSGYCYYVPYSAVGYDKKYCYPKDGFSTVNPGVINLGWECKNQNGTFVAS